MQRVSDVQQEVPRRIWQNRLIPLRFKLAEVPQRSQPPASSDIHVGQQKQAAVAFSGRPGTNRLHAIVNIR